jgi:ribonuclease PH
MARSDGRDPSSIRPLTIAPMPDSWAEGAVTITLGGTRVICTATIEERVPAHRRGTRLGWVTAEYGMLPRSTQERSPRERGGRLDGRSQEIQRLVARSLRAAVDMRLLGERTVIVDCDVIRADGGTRTASISGGFVALALACRRLLEAGMVRSDPLLRQVAAVSAGLVDGAPLVDLDYGEDSRASTDLNLVMTERLEIVEVQGTAEGVALPRDQLDPILSLAEAGIKEILGAQRAVLGLTLS